MTLEPLQILPKICCYIATFTYSPLGTAFEKQTKTIEDEGIKWVEVLKALKQEENQSPK